MSAKRKERNLTPDDGAWICISSSALHWDVQYLLGNAEVSVTGGRGGFETVTRPKRKGLTRYAGTPPYSMTLPLMIDAWIDDINAPGPNSRKPPPKFKSIEKNKKRQRARNRWRKYRDHNEPVNVQQYIDLLEDLALPEGKGKDPPTIRIYGRSIPSRLNGHAWKVNDIDLGRRMYDRRSGNLRRQVLTLSLQEDTGADLYKAQRRKSHKSGDGKKGAQRYTVKEGDTLQKIASRFYGDYTQWKKIAEANKIENPRKLKPGTVLKIP